ncbi:MAG: hypothetical protein WCC87_10580 [Candidatus Korobacteraceae bacterium]
MNIIARTLAVILCAAPLLAQSPRQSLAGHIFGITKGSPVMVHVDNVEESGGAVDMYESPPDPQCVGHYCSLGSIVQMPVRRWYTIGATLYLPGGSAKYGNPAALLCFGQTPQGFAATKKDTACNLDWGADYEGKMTDATHVTLLVPVNGKQRKVKMQVVPLKTPWIPPAKNTK